MSQKNLWLYVFVQFSQKNFFLFFFFFVGETKKFYVFYAFLTQAIILRKVVWRPADKTWTWKILISKISKPFDRSTSYLIWWYKKIIDINDIFFNDLDSRSKVKFQGQTGWQLNLGSYLGGYFTYTLHTWYQGTT